MKSLPLGGCRGGRVIRPNSAATCTPGKGRLGKKRTGQICSKRCVSTWEGARPEKQASNLYARHIGYLFLSLAIEGCIFLNAVFVENGGCVAGWLPVARQAAAARQCTQVRPPRAVGDARSSRNLSFWPTPRQAPPTTPSKSALLLTSDLLAAATPPSHGHNIQSPCFKLLVHLRRVK